jgi:hypothetical protein
MAQPIPDFTAGEHHVVVRTRNPRGTGMNAMALDKNGIKASRDDDVNRSSL